MASDPVDICTIVAKLINALINLLTSPLSLYINVKEVNLSRQGFIFILQLLVFLDNRTYLIDIYTLSDKAFLTLRATGQSLKRILESDFIPKVFYDVRCDYDALFCHFRINLTGIHDI